MRNRNLKSIALIAALALANVAYANSVPVDYDNATVTGQSADAGTFGEAVNFVVSAGTVDLGVMKPSETYTITIPVENTTDRAIAVTLTDVVAASGLSSIASIVSSTATTALVIAAGATENLTIEVTTKAAGAVTPGAQLTISYGVSGTSAY